MPILAKLDKREELEQGVPHRLIGAHHRVLRRIDEMVFRVDNEIERRGL